MTQEEVFRLKPGDLLRVEAETDSSPPYLQTTYAIVVAGAGPNVTLAWQQRQVFFDDSAFTGRARGAHSAPFGHWLTLDHSVISSVLHRSRLTRIA
jgi:hypothetical protein